MGLFQILDDGQGSNKPGSRRHPGPEEQSSYLHHIHSRNRTSMDYGSEVMKTTFISTSVARERPSSYLAI